MILIVLMNFAYDRQSWTLSVINLNAYLSVDVEFDSLLVGNT